MINVHCGCGPIHIQGWVNVDKEAAHNPDICCDARDLEYPENWVDLIYLCHSLEHFPWPDGVTKFFSVAQKILKPGGTMRLVVPDLMKVAKLYVEGDDLKGIYGPDFKVEGPDCAATRFMAFARGWQHTVLFDERLLRMLMEQAGFVNIRIMPFGESDVEELRGLDRFQSESVSMECEKP